MLLRYLIVHFGKKSARHRIAYPLAFFLSEFDLDMRVVVDAQHNTKRTRRNVFNCLQIANDIIFFDLRAHFAGTNNLFPKI